jgi:hypothetical protein
MDPTDRYYEHSAAKFFGSTVGVDMAPIHQRFLAELTLGARSLDADCGSGRDAKAFAEAGFQVTAFVASPELARLASAFCEFDVAVRRFEDVDEVETFDGIWCCASLLHVPLVWLTNDQRPDRTERWTNALATRKPVPSQRLVTGGADHVLPHLSEAFTWATQADLAVAFIKTTGLRLLLPDLESMVEAGAPQRVRVLTSDYLALAALTASREGGYRRLLAHFAPSFLLGLTAKPDRTDPSDILSLRDDNLVYSCHLFAGIQATG